MTTRRQLLRFRSGDPDRVEVYPLVSLVRLLDPDPEILETRFRTIGFLRLEPKEEISDLCLTKDDVEHHIVSNCVWLALDESQTKDLLRYSGKAVLVGGRYKINVAGTVGMIYDVFEVLEWRSGKVII